MVVDGKLLNRPSGTTSQREVMSAIAVSVNNKGKRPAAMSETHHIAMLGTGFIADFYTNTLHSQRTMDRVHTVYSLSPKQVDKHLKDKWDVPNKTTDLNEAIQNDTIDTVIIGLPNHRHEEAVIVAADAGKAILCTKPLGRTAQETLVMLEAVEKKRRI
ncbi:MAG: hypothetical protein Ct9H300mP29_8950 [Candidatus Neomarinimicrobiota bacterium]|nr:MAG: hypothetical protein Ct9H300mP29_8950 [Candidatus Neomarinimicrobiota bacterium]